MVWFAQVPLHSIWFQRFITEETNGVKIVTGLEVVEVEWEKDENGAWKLIEKEETKQIVPADMVILAMGFVGPEKV